MDNVWLRRFKRSPIYYGSLFALVLIINSIGATVITFAGNVLHPELAGANAKRLLALNWRSDRPLPSAIMTPSAGYDENAGFPFRTYEALKESCSDCAEVLASTPLGVGEEKVTIDVGGRTVRVVGEAVTPNYFNVIGVRSETQMPLRFADSSGQIPSIVISDRLWSSLFNRNIDAIGALAQLDQLRVQIVGVADRAFTGIEQGRPVDFWIPLKESPAAGVQFDPHLWDLNILVLPTNRSRSSKEIVPELSSLAESSLIARSSSTSGVQISVEVRSGTGGFGILRTIMEPFVLTLIIVIALLIITALMSLALLVFVRVTNEQRSTAVRLALGGHPKRIVAAFARELMVIFLLASTAGLACGFPLSRYLSSLISESLWNVGLFVPLHSPGRMTSVALIIVNILVALSLSSLMLFFLPRDRSVLYNPATSGLAKIDGTRTRRLVSAAILAELALTLATVIACSLLIRNAERLLDVPLGFDPENLVLASIFPPGKNDAFKHASTPTLRSLYADVLGQLAARFGRANVGLSAVTPVSSWDMVGLPLSWEGTHAQSRKAESVPVNFVGGQFFQTMGIPIVLGRGLNSDDISRGAKFAVISQKTALRYYGKQNPLGHQVRFQELTFEIIGVAGDVHYLGPRGPVHDCVYLPYTEFVGLANVLPEGFNVEIRAGRHVADVASIIRMTAKNINASAQVVHIRTERSQINDDLSEERITAILSAVVNFVLLVVTAIAVYGVLAQSVSRRRQEFAVRLALGASRWDIALHPLRQLGYLLIMALVIVAPMLFSAFKLLDHSSHNQLVNQLITTDVASAVGIALLSVCSVCAVGAAVPVIRTLKISPAQVLRAE